MKWTEKKARHPDANIAKSGKGWSARVRFKLPDGTLFERELTAGTKTTARKLRDDLYAAYNARSLEILSSPATTTETAPRSVLTLEELAATARDSWWPARGRSVDIAEQYHQKLRDYVNPVLGASTPITAVTARDWDRVLAHALTCSSDRGGVLTEGTIRKIKACFSSALSCAVVHGELDHNPIKGIPFNPNPLAEADRQGIDVEDFEDDGPDKRKLSQAEVELLLKAAKDTLIYPVLVLQLGFGLRIAEALAVRWSDFAWAENELRVRGQAKRRRNPAWRVEMEADGYPGTKVPKSILQRVGMLKSKSGRRDIHLFPDAHHLLDTLERSVDAAYVAPSKTGGLIEPRNAQRMYRDLFIAAKLAPKRGEEATWSGATPPSSHSLRSWRLSHWANVLGLPASHLQRLAGHSRIETTMKFYVRSDNRSLSDWLSLNGGSVPPPSPLASNLPLLVVRSGSDSLR